jgi:hypothetical protein
MSRLSVLILAVLLSACSTCGTDKAVHSRPTETRPLLPVTAPALVSVLYPSHVEDWSMWARTRATQLSIELGIPEPASILLIYSPGPVSSKEQEVIQWIAGYFDRDSKSIWLWLRNPIGTDVDFNNFKACFYHEFLHWLDYLHGVSNPVDHNDLFDYRIKSYGWN